MRALPWLLFLCFPMPLLAWNAAGHQVVGAVADRLLRGTPVETRVRDLLGGSLQTASVWLDCARGVRRENGAFVYTTAGRYPECQPFESDAGRAELNDYVSRNWTQCRRAATDDLCHAQYHYANIPVQRDAYVRGTTGTSDHDVVAAIEAAIAVLRGRPAPPPFSLSGPREALRLLVHAVGDLHQPLHLGAVYLDAEGKVVDPDAPAAGRVAHTQGGNRLLDGERNLHAEWDDLAPELRLRRFGDRALSAARRVPPTPGPPERWPAQWANESLALSRAAYAPLVIGPRNAKGDWPITLPPGYEPERIRVQHVQLPRAGARLAQLLTALLGTDSPSQEP
jgi:hypothetical protein